MTTKKRFLTMLIAFAVLFVMLYSAFYIAVESNHDCAGENCHICHQISICQTTLKNLSLSVCVAVFVAVFVYIILSNISVYTDFIQNCTLVSLKVKLSN